MKMLNGRVDEVTLNMKDVNVAQTTSCEQRKESSQDDIKGVNEIEPLQNYHIPAITKVSRWCSQECNSKLIKRRLPIVSWLPYYNIKDLKGDLIAGITVALTVIPQGLALASLAGLPPQYGLYTAFMGCFMYTIFGSCKDLTIGPTAIMSLMTAEHSASGGVTYVILITFLSGCIQLAMGILNLGFLVTFISSSVVSGFTSAAAITIAMTQLSGIFGIFFKSEGFLEDVYHFFAGIKNGSIRYWDMTMGLCSLLFIFLLKYINKKKVQCCGSGKFGSIMTILLHTICIARNALLVLLCATIAAVLIICNINVLTLTNKVKPGLPPFAFPEFTYDYFSNATNKTIHKSFVDIAQDMGTGLVVIPLLCLLEAIAIAKSFAKGKKLDATQEMIAIGICNIMGSFVSSYPATGSFSRTAINYSSGVRTTAGGIVTGSLVLLALGVMSPYFYYIPKSSLSALIFMAVLDMVHYKDVVVMWRTSKWDLLPFCGTFIFSFILGLEYGIIIGIGISLILLLLHMSRPKILIEEKKTFIGCSYLYVKPDRTVLFPSAESLHTKVIKSIPDQEISMYIVLIDGEHITAADYTLALNIESMVDKLKNENIYVIFINLRMIVQNAIKGALSSDFVYFLSKEDAENYINTLSIRRISPPAYSEDSLSLRSDDVSLHGS